MPGVASHAKPSERHPDMEETPESYTIAFDTALSDLNSQISIVQVASGLPSLQHALAQARTANVQGAPHWVGYEQRRAREALRAAEEAVDALTRRLRPRARFRFRQQQSHNIATDAAAEQPVYVQDEPVAPVATRDVVAKCVCVDQERVLAAGGTVVLGAEELIGSDVLIENITDATVVLLGVVGAVRTTDLHRCVVVAGAVAGSVHLTRCTGCVFRLACRQVRVHQCNSCDFWLDVRSAPIVEGCSRVRFGEGHIEYKDARQVRAEAGLEGGANCWGEVKDFLWLREGPSPNWEKVYDNGLAEVDQEGKVVVIDQAGDGGAS